MQALTICPLLYGNKKKQTNTETEKFIYYDFRSRVCPRFFDQVGHETMYASSRNKHFSLNLVIVTLTKIMNRADKNWAQF